MIRVLIEALVIGLKIYWAANKAGKREVVGEINRTLDAYKALPPSDDVARANLAMDLTRLMREL